jgi:hypothetical protein
VFLPPATLSRKHNCELGKSAVVRHNFSRVNGLRVADLSIQCCAASGLFDLQSTELAFAVIFPLWIIRTLYWYVFPKDVTRLSVFVFYRCTHFMTSPISDFPCIFCRVSQVKSSGNIIRFGLMRTVLRAKKSGARPCHMISLRAGRWIRIALSTY